MSIARIFGFAALFGLGFTGKFAMAQHLHAHGGHYDVHQNVGHGHDMSGHMIDRAGHHIDGHGHHTGGVGVYDSGAYTYPRSSFYGGSWNQPYYSYPSISRSPSIIYSTPGIVSSSIGVPSSPVYSSAKPILPEPNSIVANRIPVPGGARPGALIKLINPRSTGGSVSYTLNNFKYTINPGESQTLNLDREWVISFGNGLGKQVNYRLAEGFYEFTVSPDTGWDVGKRVEVEPALPSTPTIVEPPQVPTNAIPIQSNPVPTALPSIAIPTAQ